MKPLFGLAVTLVVVSLCECIPAGADEQPLKPGQSFNDCVRDCPEMAVIPAGSFAMGSPQAEPGRKRTEAPQHIVTVPVHTPVKYLMIINLRTAKERGLTVPPSI